MPASPICITPRAYAPETGEVLPVDDLIRPWLDRYPTGVIHIVGEPGSGRTTTLRFIETEFEGSQAHVLDGAPLSVIESFAQESIVVCAAIPGNTMLRNVLAVLNLAPWTQDDVIEFLLKAYPSRCQSVMSRIRSEDLQQLDGHPQLCRMILERMAADDDIESVTQALQIELDQLVSESKVAETAIRYAIGELSSKSLRYRSRLFKRIRMESRRRELVSLLTHRIVQIQIATTAITRELEENGPFEFLGDTLPRSVIPVDFVKSVANALTPTAAQNLAAMLASAPKSFHPMIVSVLHARDYSWRPPLVHEICFRGAYLAQCQWDDIDLSRRLLDRCDLRNSNLANADFTRSDIASADFSGANLTNAKLQVQDATQTNFTRANLTSADLDNVDCYAACFESARLDRASLVSTHLQSCVLKNASLVNADLTYAVIDRGDLSGANFSHATIRYAQLQNLDLKEVKLDGVDLEGTGIRFCDLEFVVFRNVKIDCVHISESYLTGSITRGACFRDATIRNCGLADIDWENADFREAKIQNCTFHMGSSRSGLVDSTIASEGTRTGFYTDDYNEQHFKAPEEIRKANLCGADFRGAEIIDVDFYLVDVRGAIYSVEQRLHFEKCGAILHDPD